MLNNSKRNKKRCQGQNRRFFNGSIILAVLLTFIFSFPALGAITPGVTQRHNHPDDPDYDSTKYTWFSYVPASANKSNKTYIILAPEHPQYDDYRDIIDSIPDGSMSIQKSLFDNYGYFIIVPAIPRDFDNNYYPQALFPNSFSPSTPDFYYRPDLKINTIIDEFTQELTTNGYQVQKKVFVKGFSAGGTWANRYPVLHPNRVSAAAAGHCGGFLTLPEATYNGTDLDYPLGINNMQDLVGYGFDSVAYSSISHFIYIGSEDNTNSLVPNLNPDQQSFLNTNFGYTDPTRLQNQALHMANLGYNVTFKLYPGADHYTTWDPVYFDIINF